MAKAKNLEKGGETFLMSIKEHLRKILNRRNFKKSFLGFALSLAIVSTSISPPVTAFASKNSNNHEKLNSSFISILPADGQKVVRPDTPIQIVLKADKKTLKLFEINKDKHDNKDKGSKKQKDRFGVLISGGQQNFLATKSNGGLKVNYDSADNTVKIAVQHQTFKRYTDYNVYLLTKDVLNKYKAALNSNKRSQAFTKMLEKDNDKHVLSFGFETGSDIGEAS